MASQKMLFYRATIINPLSDTKCDYLPDGLLVVKGQKILEILPFARGAKKYKSVMSGENTQDLTKSLIIPGFYDLHFHWVQDDVREMPKDSLLQWLESYTFPAEMKYADSDYSKCAARGFFRKLSAHGTVGGACYSSIHECALDAAMNEARGDFVIGNVLMNMNSPKELTQTEKESLALVKKGIKKYGKRYCLTPRFAISTSPIVMKDGSKLADKAKCFKQTHLSETQNEIDFVLSLYRAFPQFEKVKSYTEIYKKTGMLGSRSLMGHGIHLGDEELKTLSKTKTSVIHCPTSNAPIEKKGLGSGLFDFKKIEKAKVRWSLGSDIGGGPFLSMLDVMGSFVEQNQAAGVKDATYVKALCRSTLEGAKILGLGKKSGNFEKGKFANFTVVKLKKKPAATAEKTLSDIISPLRTKREAYASLISMTSYKSEIILND